MKLTTFAYIASMLTFSFSQPTMADELTAKALQGKWLWTHMVMEGSQEMRLDISTEFQADGIVVFYLPTGDEHGRGSYEVDQTSIIYTDKNGKQVWMLVATGDGKLHVDHRGAQMFFERQ